MRLHHKHIQETSRPLTAPGALGQDFSEQQVRDVYRFVYRHVGNREDAEDLTERAFSLANRASRSTQAASRRTAGAHHDMTMESRLYHTVRSVVEEYTRTVYHSPQSLASDNSVDWAGVAATRSAEQVTSGSELAGRILAQLPARDRDFLTYRFLYNDSLAETASRMGITPAGALALQWSALTHAAQLAMNEKSIASTSCASAAEASCNACC